MGVLFIFRSCRSGMAVNPAGRAGKLGLEQEEGEGGRKEEEEVQ